MHTPFTLWMNFLHVQMICITDLYDCVNPYTVIFLYVCMFTTCSTSYCLVTASRIHGMYVCMYVRTECESNVCTVLYLFVADNIFFLHKIPQQDGKLHAYNIYGIF